MALLAPFDRPLALRLLGEVDASAACRRTTASPGLRDPGSSRSRAPDAATRTRLEIAMFLVYVLLTDVDAVRGVVAELEASVDESVVVWSPCVCTRSRTDLVAALLDGDDAITDVACRSSAPAPDDIDGVRRVAPRGAVQQRGVPERRRAHRAVGRLVEASGVLVVVFRQNGPPTSAATTTGWLLSRWCSRPA